jgi:acyl-CoA synthetase (AMP-forming)/AMP-acid ligase II
VTAPPVLARISDYVRHHAELQPQSEALVGSGRRWRYAALARDVNRFAKALLAAGIGRGDRVAILATPRPECFLGFLAASSLGAVTLGLSPKFPPGELGYFVADAEPRLLLGWAHDAEGDHRATLEALGRAHACVEQRIAIGEEAGAQPWERWLAAGDAVPDGALALARAEVSADDAALLVYTSGTTGQPKGALIPHRALAFCSAVQAGHWSAEPLRSICNLPVNHIGFMGDISSYVLVAGGTTFYMERFDPPAMLDLIERERITGWGQVPTMFQLALATPGFAARDLSSLQWIIWGGSSAPRDMIAALQRTGARLATSYGSTETGGSVTYTDPDADLDTLAETVGRPDPRFAFRIAGEDGRALTPGETGEILVRGEHGMLGYWRRPEATREAIDADGWLHTGDLAVLRADGNVALRGRLSEMYKSGGENVYPREVETVLEAHPDVALAAVLGVPDPVYAEVGAAWVIRRPHASPSPEALRAFCRERLVNFKVPKTIAVRDALPMLPIGKVDKRALRREAEPPA